MKSLGCNFWEHIFSTQSSRHPREKDAIKSKNIARCSWSSIKWWIPQKGIRENCWNRDRLIKSRVRRGRKNKLMTLKETDKDFTQIYTKLIDWPKSISSKLNSLLYQHHLTFCKSIQINTIDCYTSFLEKFIEVFEKSIIKFNEIKC